MPAMPRVHSLHIYPIKSCREIRLHEADVTPLGLKTGNINDRSWAIINENGVCLTQRQYPQLARVEIQLLRNHNGWANGIAVAAPGMKSLTLDPDEKHDPATLRHFSDKFPGHLAAPEAHEWFSAFLDMPAILVRQGGEDLRFCDAHFAQRPCEDRVSFADGYPILLTNMGTLEKLNRDLLNNEDGEITHPVSMRRFRPNIVVDQAPAEIEYTWDRINIRRATIALVKPCTRCVMTSVDPASGVITGREPLETLKRTSFIDIGEGKARVRGAVFGQNCIAAFGTIGLESPVSVTAQTPRRDIFGRGLTSSL